MKDRLVTHLLASVITDYIREVQDKSIGEESPIRFSGPCLDHYQDDVGTSQIGVAGGIFLESGGYRSSTCHTLRSLQQVHGVEEIWDCTCVTSPPFFSQIGSLESRSSETVTAKPVVIMWDGLNVEGRESVMSVMTMSNSWVLWKQHDSLSNTKTGENVTEEKLQLLLGECGLSLTDKEGRTTKGSNKNRRKMNTGVNKASDSEYGGKTQNEGWTGGPSEVLGIRTCDALVK